ncbi:hypothetical protein l11_12930 [Neisseria weaveri LMG 5135]|nr:hypothetical protein l11_12930 [Neisseria weaveri LMG 5135]
MENVSTHSRPKAAVSLFPSFIYLYLFVSTHSRPKAAVHPHAIRHLFGTVSTHSRPKAAVFQVRSRPVLMQVSTHSRPKAAVAASAQFFNPETEFQHTAARRRLFKGLAKSQCLDFVVSTHSRPKAAVLRGDG